MISSLAPSLAPLALFDVAELQDSLRSMAPLDLIGISLAAIGILIGVWRGLWWQVIRLLGLVVAVAVARVFSPETALWLNESWPELSPRLAHGIAWGGVFLLSLGAASILGLLGQKMLEVMQLGLANRLAGGIAGGATGLVVHLTLLVFVCQLGPEEYVAEHVTGTYSESLLEQAGSRWRIVLGAEAAAEVDRLLGHETRGRGVEPAAEGSAVRESSFGSVR